MARNGGKPDKRRPRERAPDSVPARATSRGNTRPIPITPAIIHAQIGDRSKFGSQVPRRAFPRGAIRGFVQEYHRGI
jgi:hypothetical protein